MEARGRPGIGFRGQSGTPRVPAASRRGWWAVALAVSSFVGLFDGLALAQPPSGAGPREPRERPGASAVERCGGPGYALRLTVEPEGARLRVDGVDLAYVPQVVCLDRPGPHYLQISAKGYVVESLVVHAPLRYARRSIHLVALPRLSVLTNPRGANVLAGSTDLGTTPLGDVVIDDQPRAFDVTIHKPDYVTLRIPAVWPDDPRLAGTIDLTRCPRIVESEVQRDQRWRVGSWVGAGLGAVLAVVGAGLSIAAQVERANAEDTYARYLQLDCPGCAAAAADLRSRALAQARYGRQLGSWGAGIGIPGAAIGAFFVWWALRSDAKVQTGLHELEAAEALVRREHSADACREAGGPER